MESNRADVLRRHFESALRITREILDALPPVLLTIVVLGVIGVMVGASSLVVAEIIEEVMDGHATRPDARIVEAVEGSRSDPLTAFFRATTRLADTWVVTFVVSATAGALLVRGHRALALAVAVSAIGTAVITALLKDAIGRDRPPPISHLVEVSGQAFPSGHASMAVACYGAIALAIAVTATRRATRIIVLVGAAGVAFAVGVSRVYLGVHWPSDVITGWIVGLSWLFSIATLSWLAWRLDRPRGWWRTRYVPGLKFDGWQKRRDAE